MAPTDRQLELLTRVLAELRLGQQLGGGTCSPEQVQKAVDLLEENGFPDALTIIAVELDGTGDVVT